MNIICLFLNATFTFACTLSLVLALTLTLASPSYSAVKKTKNGDLKIYQNQLNKIEQSIQITKEKIASTQTTKFLPDMYYMLAELMAEKSNFLYIIKKESNPSVPESELDLTAEKRSKLEAIDSFKQLAQRYPNYKSLDKVFYIIGQELKNLGEFDQALQFFKKSSDQFPKSLFAPKSIMEVGHIFFEKKDFDFALEQYKKALPLSQGVDSHLILNKMASCYSFKGEWKNAFQQYLLVIEQPYSKESLEAKEEALVQSIWPLLELPPTDFSNLKKIHDIIQFYKKSSFDQESFRKSLDRLSKRLEFKKRDSDIADVQLELFRIHRDYKLKKDSFESYFNYTRTQTKYDYPHWIPKHLMEMLLSIPRPSETATTQKDQKKYEEPFRHIITSQHKNAITNNRLDDQLKTIKNYDYYLAVYPGGPQNLSMLKNKAELEFLSNKLVDAASDYYQISQSPDEKMKKTDKEFLISSLDSSLKALEKAEEDIFIKVRSRELYAKVGNQFKKKFPNDPKTIDIDFNKAKSLYDDQKLNEAAVHLLKFVKKHPKAPQANSAVLLALDCFYLQEKPDKVAKLGRIFLGISDLSLDIKSQIKNSIQQAKLKEVRSLAGDFTSNNYAQEFVAFAKKNKNSSMGEQALYEAFQSLKAATKEEALSVGEDYMGSYGNHPHAKEVLLQMSQISLVLLNFSKAASYMATYGQKYPNDPNSKELLEQAANLYSRIGKTNEAFIIYQMLGQPEKGLAILTQWSQWSQLESKASQVQGLTGLYYQGLSQIRGSKKPEGLQLLIRAFGNTPKNEDEKNFWSHSGVIIAENEFNNLIAKSKSNPFSMELLQALLEQYQTISGICGNIISNGSGLWKLAALSLSANTNSYFSGFLEKAPPPNGISLEQFKNVITPQVNQYRSIALQNFSSCYNVAEENEIVSGFVTSCANRTFWSEQKEDFQMRVTRLPSSQNYEKLKVQIKNNPRSSELIKKMAVEQILGQNEAEALTLLTRARDLDNESAEIDSLKAAAWFRMGSKTNAMQSVQEALGRNSNEPLALAIKKKIFSQLGYKKKLAQLNSLGFKTKSPYYNLIPN